MLNHGKSDVGTKINVIGTNNYVMIYPRLPLHLRILKYTSYI